MGNSLNILDANKRCGKLRRSVEVRHKYVPNDLNILNMTSMCGKRFKYLRNGFTMLEMT